MEEVARSNRVAPTRALDRQQLQGAEDTAAYLAGLTGESADWPTDNTFATARRDGPAYQRLNTPRLTHILLRLDQTYHSRKMEDIEIRSELTIEHIMPQTWQPNWPLPDGSQGKEWKERWDAEPGDPRADATRKRNDLVHTMGNLTLLTHSLNAAVSNGPWPEKKPELLLNSLLPIKQVLHRYGSWDEETIKQRSDELLQRALQLWPRNASGRYRPLTHESFSR